MLFNRSPRISRNFKIVLILLVLCPSLAIKKLTSRHYPSAWSILSGLSESHDSVNHYRWQPPFDWAGESSVYDNFRSINEQYSFGVRDNKRPAQASARQAEFVLETLSDNTVPDAASSRVSCLNARGRVLNSSATDAVESYAGRHDHFPEPALGSSRIVGFESNVCYDRYGRHVPYGWSLTDTKHPLQEFESKDEKNFQSTNWATLQQQCLEKNKHRFNHLPRNNFGAAPLSTTLSRESNRNCTTRTAVVIRSHQDQTYTAEIKRTIRSIIEELALYSGAEYAVFLFVHVKDTTRQIWEDSTMYQQAIVDLVPAEFRSITVLWNSVNWHERYDGIPRDYLNVHMSQWLPMQYFQSIYPEFDYYWNWEMDVRFTGHYHDFVRAVDHFSMVQPRKGLWERNERFYIPRLHGSYKSFRLKTQERYVNASDMTDASIWGPRFPGDKATIQQHMRVLKMNVTPPVASPDQDNYEWGVGESADFLTFLPMFNPDPTAYVFHDAFRGYDRHLESREVYRRTSIITFSRLSSRLLRLMELENRETPMHHMTSESWPHSVALHYGLKAVSIPHGIYMEQEWPLQALDFIFNNGDQDWTLSHHPHRTWLNPNGEGSGGPESTFGWGREHNWMRSTWYYQNRFAERLYKRWLGWEYDGIGGPQWEKKHGAYCLPPMLLHPIKIMTDPAS